MAGNQPDQTVKSLELSKFNKIRMLFFVQNFDPDYPEPSMFPFEIKITKDEKENLCMNGISPASNPAYFAHVEACVDKLAE